MTDEQLSQLEWRVSALFWCLTILAVCTCIGTLAMCATIANQAQRINQLEEARR